MSAEELLEMTEKISSAVTNTQAIRDKIFEEFGAATSSEQRDSLLAMFTATMNVAESWLAGSGTQQQLEEFRRARADDYTKLLVNESTVAGVVSPVTFMAVTNREISAGRLTPDDPIRQVAVKAAAAIPQVTHGELLAIAEAKERSDMSIASLINEMKTTKNFDIVDIRAKIQSEFEAAQTSEQRGTVLALFKAAMDLTERNLQGDHQAELLANFQEARAQDYKIFIVQESTVGLDTPVVGGDVSVDMLMAVTNREVAAGRMTEDHSLRRLAVDGAAAPHLSHAELLVKHARLKAEAAQSSPRSAHAIGATLGKKLKGLFRSRQ
jgi:hypothetical protein